VQLRQAESETVEDPTPQVVPAESVQHSNGDVLQALCTGQALEEPSRDAAAEAANEAREAFISSTRDLIRKATDWHTLGVWWNSPEQKNARSDFELDAATVANLVAFVKARIDVPKSQRMEAAE
jgi:hypothetical protein